MSRQFAISVSFCFRSSVVVFNRSYLSIFVGCSYIFGDVRTLRALSTKPVQFSTKPDHNFDLKLAKITSAMNNYIEQSFKDL